MLEKRIRKLRVLECEPNIRISDAACSAHILTWTDRASLETDRIGVVLEFDAVEQPHAEVEIFIAIAAAGSEIDFIEAAELCEYRPSYRKLSGENVERR